MTAGQVILMDTAAGCQRLPKWMNDGHQYPMPGEFLDRHTIKLIPVPPHKAALDPPGTHPVSPSQKVGSFSGITPPDLHR